MKRTTDSDRRWWAYLEEEVPASEAAVLEAELRDSAAARRELDRLRELREGLVAVDPDLEQLDLVPALQRSLRPATAAPSEGCWRPRGRRLLALALPLAACLLLVIGLPYVLPRAGAPVAGTLLASGSGDEEAFRSKATGTAADPDRWVGIQAFRVVGKGPAERLGRRLLSRDGLLFAYTNLGPTPFSHLMIFAVDSKGEVFWFFPAYQRQGTDARAITIAKGRVSVELPELIRHRFAPGPLAIVGLFSRRAISVLEVEGLFRDLVLAGRWHSDRPARLALPETGQHLLSLQVDP